MSKQKGTLASLGKLFKPLFGISSTHSRSKGVKPWKIYERQAMQHEHSGAYKAAILSYEKALKELSAYFEPSKIENKYYNSKKSEIRFKLERIHQIAAKSQFDTKGN